MTEQNHGIKQCSCIVVVIVVAIRAPIRSATARSPAVVRSTVVVDVHAIAADSIARVVVVAIATAPAAPAARTTIAATARFTATTGWCS